LLKHIKAVEHKSYKQIALECGYKTENYFSHVLKDEKKGREVPDAVMNAIKTRFAAVVNDEVVVEMQEDEITKRLLEYVGALRTQVHILTHEVASLKAHAYHSDFDNVHAELQLRMKEGVEPTLRTMQF